MSKTNPALEEAIFANPYDREAYSVCADWLQGEGDPRGELIALQIAGKDKAAAKLLESHADALLGPLAAYQDAKGGDDKLWAEFTWKYGFIHAAHLSSGKGPGLAEPLEALLCHPSGRFLTELKLGFNGDRSGNLQDLVDTLAKKAPRSLRKLHLGAFSAPDVDRMNRYEIGDLSELWAGVPQLTTLIMHVGWTTLGSIALPNLVSATFQVVDLREPAQAIASACWPKLEELEVWFGNSDNLYDFNAATVKDVQPLLDRIDLPALRKLGLKNTAFTDALCAVLPGAKLVEQLTELDLSMGCMTDDGARALTGNAALGHLAVLDVSENYLTSAGLTVLERVASCVIGGDVQSCDAAPEDRQPSIEYRGWRILVDDAGDRQ